jgi:metal-responsive CopG/Arc/MetJ family transcriptional regulator
MLNYKWAYKARLTRKTHFMNTKRTHIVIPQQLVMEIDTLVGKRSRSTFLTQAAEKELMRLRQIKALEGAAGAWKDKDHPELKQGAAKWVKKLRQEYDQRFEKVTTR